MPDASGKFKGISVPAIPWHGKAKVSDATKETIKDAVEVARAELEKADRG